MVMLPNNPRYAYDAGNSAFHFSPLYTGKPVITIPISFTYSL
jgi:hypothetical protein